MSKPLEMPIHPKLKWPRRGSEIEPYRKQWKAENALRLSKRFTDAELAAEYYSWNAHFNKMQWVEEVLMQQDEPAWSEDKWEVLAAPLNALYRFATTPSYDEAAS